MQESKRAPPKDYRRRFVSIPLTRSEYGSTSRLHGRTHIFFSWASPKNDAVCPKNSRSCRTSRRTPHDPCMPPDRLAIPSGSALQAHRVIPFATAALRAVAVVVTVTVTVTVAAANGTAGSPACSVPVARRAALPLRRHELDALPPLPVA